MTHLLLFGLLSWLVIGAIAGGLAAKLLPGQPPLPALATVLVGLVGAMVGGLLATVLDFGGLAVYDIRSFALATLFSLIGLGAFRTAKLAS